MGLDDILSNAREVVRKVVPGTVEITNIEFEGPTIVLYTKNMDVFAENNDLVRQLAQSLRKRVRTRPAPPLPPAQDEAEKVIREIIPADAQITSIYFETDSGEVTIEALSPGLRSEEHTSELQSQSNLV